MIVRTATFATFVLLGVASCRRAAPEESRPRKRAEEPSPSAAPLPTAVPSVVVPDPEAVAGSRLREYAALFPEPDLPDCRTYGIFLRIGPATQQSSQAWLAETVRAEPLFAKALDDDALHVSDYIYGNHYFAHGASNRFATTVHCSDHLLCRAFAGLYGRVDVEAKPKAFCEPGTPGSSSGNFFNKERLRKSARSHPHGTCGRYRACLAAENLPQQSCDGFEVSARKCAEIESCGAALACFEKEPRDPRRRLWRDEVAPARRSGEFGF